MNSNEAPAFGALRLSCVDCRSPFESLLGRGRPRKRCTDCSPPRLGRKHEKRSQKGVRREVVCAVAACGARFVTTYPSRRFCGAQCRIAYNNRAAQEARRDRGARPCGFCGKEFAPAYGDLRSKFCCRECKVSDAYRRSTGSTHRRRARQFGAEFIAFDKREVFARDGWRCRLCGVKTPRELQGTQAPNAPELDHVVPLSLGGAHRPENTQCACRRCNATKKDRPRGQLGLRFN